MTATMTIDCPALADAPSRDEESWHAVKWCKANRTVRRLQARIVKAVQAGKRQAMDNGYFGPKTIEAFEEMGIDPYIAAGRESHHLSLDKLLQGEPEPPPEDADHKTKMLYKLRTQAGKAIYKLRKSTVEPVFGIIKEIMGFRQFSLRGLKAAAGEWNLVSLAYNLKRLHILHTG